MATYFTPEGALIYDAVNASVNGVFVTTLATGTVACTAKWIWAAAVAAATTAVDKKEEEKEKKVNELTTYYVSDWILSAWVFVAIFLVGWTQQLDRIVAELQDRSPVVPPNLAAYEPVVLAASLLLYLALFAVRSRLSDDKGEEEEEGEREKETSTTTTKPMTTTTGSKRIHDLELGNNSNGSGSSSSSGCVSASDPSYISSPKSNNKTFNEKKKKKKEQEDGKKIPTTNTNTNTTTPTKTTRTTTTTTTKKKGKKKKNIAFVTNIKIFLTFMVFLHHVAGALITGELGIAGIGFNSPVGDWQTIFLMVFLMVNQSYFMALFFFLSGYFNPRSLDKKGVRQFLHERFIRIGIPFTLYAFVFGPWLGGAFHNSLLPGGSFTYDFANEDPIFPQVTWFLAQLLFMAILYALICGPGWHPRLAFPNVWLMMGVTFLLGIIPGVLIQYLPRHSDEERIGPPFFLMNGFWVQYPAYLVLYFFGAVAHRNDWFDTMKNSCSLFPRLSVYFVTIVFVAVVVIVEWSTPLRTELEKRNWTLHVFIESMLNGVVGGLAPCALSLAVTWFFMDYGNYVVPFWTKFFSQTMYTAYIIQETLPFPAAMYAVVAIANACNFFGSKITFDIDNPIYEMPNGDYTIAMWLLGSIFLLIIVWPTAFAIRSIPGFSNVL